MNLFALKLEVNELVSLLSSEILALLRTGQRTVNPGQRGKVEDQVCIDV